MAALVGALFVAGLAAIAGRRELPDWLTHLAFGAAGGIITGVLVGALLFAPAMTAFQHGDGKDLAMYQAVGVIFGAIGGGVIGLLAGAAVFFTGRRGPNR
jgi:hypothetical protein